MILLIIPPTLNIVLFGLALNPSFENLRLGVVDYSRTAESRGLVSAFEEGLVFQTQAYYASANELGDAISRGDLDAGLVVPRDFAEKRARRETVEVQLLVDAVNANTATIAGGYAARIVAGLNQKIALSQPPRPRMTSGPASEQSVSLATNAPAAVRTTVTPRLTRWPEGPGSNSQIFEPVAASSANTLRVGELTYMTPSTTMGLHSMVDTSLGRRSPV